MGLQIMKVKYSETSNKYVCVFSEDTPSNIAVNVIIMPTKKELFKQVQVYVLKALRKYNTVILNADSEHEIKIWYEKDYDMTPDFFKYGECKSKYYNIVQHTNCVKTNRHIERVVQRRKNPLYEK